MTEDIKTENTEKKLSKEEKKRNKKRYGIFLAVIMIMVIIVDSYSTGLPGTLQSAIANEFLPLTATFTQTQQDAVLALGSAVFSVGLWFVFFFQYYSDRIGRKKLLFITVIGMAVAHIGLNLSTNYITYVFFMLFLSFFFNSDIWMIYVNESVKPRKRAKYTYLLLFIGAGGALMMSANRMIFVASPNPIGWRGITFFPIIIAIPLSIVILWKLKESPRFQQIQNYRKQKGKTSFMQNIKAIFRIEERKSYVTMLFISFIFGVALITVNQLIQKLITNSGFTETQFNTIQPIAIFSLLIAFGANSYLLEKVGRKPMMCFYALLLPIAAILLVTHLETTGSLVSATTDMAAQTAITTSALPLLGIFLLLTNVAGWGLNTLLRIYTLEFLPTQHRGAGLGLRSLVFAVGASLGLLLSAPVILLFTLGPTMIIFVCLTFIIIPLGLLRVSETRGVDLSDIK